MAQHIFPEPPRSPNYCGLDEFYEFTNEDGELYRTNCGQAAAATLLAYCGKFPCDSTQAAQIMRSIENKYPPDQFFGFFGTGRKRVELICRQHGVPLRTICGEDELKECLRRGKPVAVMLGVSAGRFLRLFELPGGHWMVAYAFDDEYVYLSNYGRKSWEEFHRGWKSLVSRLIGMNQRGLVVDESAETAV